MVADYREMCFLDTVGQLHVGSQNRCNSMQKTCVGPRQTESQHGEEMCHEILPTAEEISNGKLLGEEGSVLLFVCFKVLLLVGQPYSDGQPHF